MQSQNYIYIAIGAALIIALGLFLWGGQPAEAPTNEEENTEQATTTDENVGGEQTEASTEEVAQRNESDMEFARRTAEPSQTGDSTEMASADTTNTDSTETTSGEAMQDVDPTAGWRTYTNQSFGIRFRVPPEWQLNENSQTGEFTMQIYSGEAEDKTAEFNLLFYPAELKRDREGNFAQTVNGEEAYVETNNCPSDVRCVLKKVIFPLEDGEVTGNFWRGDVLEVSLITGGIASGATETTLNNILDTLTFIN